MHMIAKFNKVEIPEKLDVTVKVKFNSIVSCNLIRMNPGYSFYKGSAVGFLPTLEWLCNINLSAIFNYLVHIFSTALFPFSVVTDCREGVFLGYFAHTQDEMSIYQFVLYLVCTCIVEKRRHSIMTQM